MTAIIKNNITAALLFALIILATGCKSPVSHNEEPPIAATDTTHTETAIDTGQTSAAPVKDPVAVRAPLTLIITNLAAINGPVIVGVYGTKNKFPDPEDQMKVFTFKTHGNQLTAKITSLAFGTYALAIYQDVNSNGKIDKNLIGVPTEPYAFSRNYKPVVKAPGFDNCRFDYGEKDNTITMNMIR